VLNALISREQYRLKGVPDIRETDTQQQEQQQLADYWTICYHYQTKGL